jgi:hypothetical protein
VRFKSVEILGNLGLMRTDPQRRIERQRKALLAECERKQARYAQQRAIIASTPAEPTAPTPPPRYKSKYEEYINSGQWKAFKLMIFAARGARCERCSSNRHLNLHHKTYERLTNELPTDVEILCRKCHESHHGLAADTDGEVRVVAPESATGISHLQRKWKPNGR